MKINIFFVKIIRQMAILKVQNLGFHLFILLLFTLQDWLLNRNVYFILKSLYAIFVIIP